jgi:hypothetical protein
MKRNNKRLQLRDSENTIDNQLNGQVIPDNITDEDINKVEDLENGDTVYEIGKPELEQVKDDKFDANLALKMKDEALKKVSTYILDCLEEDIEARQPWLDIHNKVKKYLGHNLEDLTESPFTQACRTYDTTLSTAVIRFCATSSSEMLPESGPCSYKIVGQSNDDLDEIANTRAQWLNYFLTVKDSAYYKDFEKSLYYIGFYGTVIKKVYYDDIVKQPISRFILPENFLINVDCTSILESDRLTHILKLSARDILINQKSNVYRDVELPYLKVDGDSNDSGSATYDAYDSKPDTSNIINITNYTQRTLHDVYESHIYLNLETFEPNYNSDEIKDIPRPYIVTIDKESKEILCIKRNWKKDDASFTRRKYFISYQYFTGFDIWGLGLARMSGTNAIAVTNMLRQTVDAATYQNLPAGFIQKGTSKQQKTDITLGAGQWQFLEGTGNIKDLFSPLPSNGPSQALMQLRQEVISQMQDQLSTAELGMMDSKEDIPTGTAIAFLEESNKIQSSVLKSLHVSFSEELRLLDDVFKEVVDREEFFINGENYIITREHFIDSVQLIPVSDPSVNSNIQRIMRAEAIFQTAMQMPDKVNIVEVLKMIFKAQGLSADVIESLIVQEGEVQPTDPISENMNMMQNKPVKAGLDQNHDAHIVVHSAVDTEQAKAHIQEHAAMKFMLQMQQEMGIDLSQIDPNDPEMQNMIAVKAAHAVESLGLNKQEQEDDELNPNALLKADIDQKREHSVIQKEIADMKLEGDVFKTQLHFEETKERLKADKEKALLEARIEIEKLKSRL